MKINRVTITGADDKVNPQDLYKLSQEFPFVEWGILFSNKKSGTERYPTRHWIWNGLNFSANFSAHFCGSYSKDIIENKDLKIIYDLPLSFRRIQINYRFKKDINENTYYFNLLSLNQLEFVNISPILQYNSNNKFVIDSFIKRYPSNFSFLYDASGGLGKEIETIQSPIGDYYTGYAGGINVDNIDRILETISKHTSNEKVWIDLESGVRTNNEFDLDKVYKILEKSSKFIK